MYSDRLSAIGHSSPDSYTLEGWGATDHAGQSAIENIRDRYVPLRTLRVLDLLGIRPITAIRVLIGVSDPKSRKE